MKPAHQDFAHRTNEQFRFRVVLRSAVDKTTPLDLSVYDELKMQVKADRFQPEPDLELSLSGGELTLESGGINGAISGVSAVSTIDDMIGVYAYDIRASAVSGIADVVLEGEIEFIQGVTV